MLIYLEGTCKGKIGVDKKTQCIVWDEVAWEKFPNLFHFFSEVVASTKMDTYLTF
jgi:hypothetical protein